MQFESTTEIEQRRQDLRQARQSHLEKAKDAYEKEERKKEQAKARGDDTWMLSSVNQRLQTEQQSMKKSKKKKKEKKKKRRKKKDSSDSDSDSDDSHSKKKKKKKKKRKKSSSSSSSQSEDESSMWVEKTSKKQTSDAAGGATAVKGPKLERDSWMNAPPELFPTITRKDLIEKKNKEKEEMDKQRELLDKPGIHAKELNPYWKDGGAGLPEERSSEVKAVSKATTGDAGLSWLKKAYERCVQQAKEEGRSLEELAAERWGSLKAIQKQIRDAEDAKYGRSRNRDADDRNGGRNKRFMKPQDDGDSDNYRQSSSRQNTHKIPERSHHRKGSRSRSGSRGHRSSSRERHRGDRRRSRSNERRSRDRRSNSRDRDRRSRERDRQRSPDRRGSRVAGSSSMKGRFMKPGEQNEGGSSRSRSDKSASDQQAPAWRKKEFQKPSQDEGQSSRSGRRRSEDREDRHRDERDRRRDRRRSSSSSDSSSSESSSDSSSDDGRGQRSSPRQQEVIVEILTEKQMNELAAKLVKAEIMGNEEQADKLKTQLEAAREAKKNAPVTAEPRVQGHPGKPQGEEEDFVTLTRSDRSGMSRPVPESSGGYVDSGGKKRRKKRKVETHTGKLGERTKYFDDDDKFDLKTMVEREKLGTAEDQNQMFARLAGRAAQRTDDDYQVDDIFLEKANQMQSESIQEQRDRAAAIFEHKKMSASLQKCSFCFGNIPKHLIIAIGTKVYLSLPNHKSLTEGHCLIVPMQHVSSSTAVDEDVWSEIQVFRKTLTRMFAEQDEDVVFMETSMRLKHFPHMTIECVPMDKEVGDLAPIYFKKAIQDSESEWSNNKKVVDLRNKDIRHAVPKGFPYFAVDFGHEGGFAHVIEDEQRFSHYFGKEIIGGMVDADHRLWKKPPKENFDDQRKKVLKFAEMWKPHDWTQNISKNVTVESSSSDSD